ncbi:MAG: hypothetical protein E7161_03890 [Firmicutes bacterium]|nr:hypothetical protein [Bacillota bacterium]
MNKLESLKSLYKPYRYTIKGKCTILETTSGNFVVKKKPKNKDLHSIFNYLKSRNFDYFPEFYTNTRDDTYVYEYIESNDIINPQKSEDLINLVGLLHSKTSFNKEVSEETYKEIYENIKNNVLYLKDYYLKYYEMFLKDIYMSPSKYQFVRNYSKIKAALNFTESELDNWYSLVKDKKNERISLIHNNLSLEHYIRSDKDYLISWDNSKFDTPVLDLVKLYQNNFWDLEFNTIYKKYLSIASLSEHEQKLFFILISLVPEIKFTDNEFDCCKNMRKNLDYIFKTEDFLKPYYSTNAE